MTEVLPLLYSELFNGSPFLPLRIKAEALAVTYRAAMLSITPGIWFTAVFLVLPSRSNWAEACAGQCAEVSAGGEGSQWFLLPALHSSLAVGGTWGWFLSDRIWQG